jgi:hypothetical protein
MPCMCMKMSTPYTDARVEFNGDAAAARAGTSCTTTKPIVKLVFVNTTLKLLVRFFTV